MLRQSLLQRRSQPQSLPLPKPVPRRPPQLSLLQQKQLLLKLLRLRSPLRRHLLPKLLLLKPLLKLLLSQRLRRQPSQLLTRAKLL
jgi:hypothetical protein